MIRLHVSLAVFLLVSCECMVQAMDEFSGSSDMASSTESSSVAKETPDKKAPEWDEAATLVIPHDDKTGITTDFFDNHTNWYHKKQILTAARKKYIDVTELKEAISQKKEEFAHVRTGINDQLNAFYKEFNIEEASIAKVLAKVSEALKEKEKTGSALDPQEQKQVEEFTQRKTALEDLQQALASVKELDTNFDKALAILFEQEELARAYEKGAGEQYDEIEKILSDQKAEVLFLHIKSAGENLAAIKQYVDDDFASFISKTKSELDKAIATVKKSMETLKEQGILLEDEIKEAQENEKKAQEEIAAKAAAQAALQKRLAERPWWQKSLDWFKQKFGIVQVYTVSVWQKAKTVVVEKLTLKKAPTKIQPKQESKPIEPQGSSSAAKSVESVTG